MTVNLAGLDQYRHEFRESALSGLEDFLRSVEGEAKRLAPVRKVFKGGGRRQLAWRNVYSTGARSDISAIREYRRTFGQRQTESENVQNFRVVNKGGRRTVQVRSYQQQEPYSSPVRSAWRKVDSGTYRRRQGSLIDASGRRRAEPFLWSGGKRGGQAYVFDAFDQLNYEGRRSLMRGMEALERGGYEFIDSHRGGVITVGGPDVKTESGAGGRGHREDAAFNVRTGRFGREFTIQLGGALRKSIEMEEPADHGSRLSGSVGTSLRYALYVEFGTAQHGKAQPYLRPALMRYRYLLAKSVASNIRHGTG